MLKHTLATFLFYLILIHPLFAQTGWQRITTPYAYGFYTNTRGLTNSYFWSSDSGFVGKWITNDGALTWKEIAIPSDTHFQDSLSTYHKSWSDLFAVSNSRINIIGTETSVTGPSYFRQYSSSFIFNESLNGGNNWVASISFGETGDYCQKAGLIDFKNSDLGYVVKIASGCGDYPDDVIGSYQLVLTNDGGNTWFDPLREYPGYLYIHCADIVDKNTCIFAGRDSVYSLFMDTVNVLDSMRSIPIDDEVVNGLAFKKLKGINKQVYLGSTTQRFLVTRDRGSHWDVIFDSCYVKDIAQANDSSIFVIIDKGIWSIVYKSVDTGRTWAPQLQISTGKFIAISAPSDSVAYAFGTNGIAYKTTDGGGTTLSVFKLRGNAEELSVFPNPTSKTIHVSFDEHPHSRTIQMFDRVGREVMRMPVVMDSGEMEIPVSLLPNGIYYLVLGTETTRFIVQK